jgi:adenine-specific DNA-methyltransferase
LLAAHHGRFSLAAPSIPTASDSVPDMASRVARLMGTAASALDPVDAGYFIGTTYAGLLPLQIRRRLGIYYTPPALVTRLLDQATAAGVDWTAWTVLDPACGGGAFLAPVAQRMMKHLSHLEPGALLDHLATVLRGFEVDPFAAWLSQVLLDATVMPLYRAAGRRLPPMIDVRNSLTREPGDTRYDLVIGNPPYGRVTLSPRTRQRYARSLYGHANLYGLFTDLALRWTRPGGVISYVTPTSFLSGEYFTRLRDLLGKEAPPVSVDFIRQRKGVFDDVLQEALLATYRRSGSPGAAPVHFLTPLDLSAVEITPAGSFSLPRPAHHPWLVPRTPDQQLLVATLRSMPHRLADWGYQVSTGPLVWNRHKDQLRARAERGTYPLIWAEAVTPDGSFVFRSRKKNHQPYFRIQTGDDWLLIREPCVLVQRTTATEQSRRLIAAELPANFIRTARAVVVENHLNMLKPLGPAPAVSPAVLAAFLNSAAADQAFRCISGSVAVSAYELEALPLPPPASLRRLGALLTSGASLAAIKTACAALYRL